MTVISFSAARARRKGRPAPDPRDELAALMVLRRLRAVKCADDLDEALDALDETLKRVNLFVRGETT